jgi:hypothetical protein
VYIGKACLPRIGVKRGRPCLSDGRAASGADGEADSEPDEDEAMYETDSD